MVVAGPLARPWREVEELAPAVLHGQWLQHCTVTATPMSLTVRLGGRQGMALTLTPREVEYHTVPVQGSTQPAAATKLPLPRLLGAKV